MKLNFSGMRVRLTIGALLLAGAVILTACGGGGGGGGGDNNGPPPPTAPSAFILSAPTDKATDVILTPTFTWTGASGVDSYTLQINTSNDFTSPLYSNSAIAANATSFSLPYGILSVGTEYYWRVIAVNAIGQTSANAVFSFTTVPTSAFDLTAPNNNSTGILFTPTLSWTDATGETSYTVQISTSETFTPLTYETTTIPANTTSFTISEANKLTVNTPYYWRVIAVNSVGQTAASNAPLTFTTLKSGELAWSQTSNPSDSEDQAFGVALDTNSLYVAGYDDSTSYADDEWRIEKRYLSNGLLVASFGTSTNPGVVAENPSSLDPDSYDRAYAIAIDPTYMYVAGFDSIPRDNDPNSTDEQWHIEKRRLSDGFLDFIVTSNTSTYNPVAGVSGEDEANAIAIDSTYMYVVGFETTTVGDRAWRIEKRMLSDGSLETPTFGISGAVVENPSSASDVPNGVTIDSTYMYIVGYETTTLRGRAWRVEKRNLTDGMPVLGFGTSGAENSDPSTGDDVANAIAIDSTYMYVVGYETNTSTHYQWRIEKRSLTDGLLETTNFGSGGVIVSNPNPGFDAAATAIAIDSAYMYVAGYDTTGSGNYEWRVEKRSLSDGSLITSFGTNGAVTYNLSTTLDADAWGIAIDSDYIYVVGDYDYDPNYVGNSQWRIEKRAK